MDKRQVSQDFKYLSENINNMKKQMVLREPDIGYGGGLKKFVKRILRKLVGWYIRPLYQQQIEFNMSVERAFEDLYRIQKELITGRESDETVEIGAFSVIDNPITDEKYLQFKNYKGKRIVQIVSSLNFGDAVGNDVIAIQNYLRQKGYVTGIFANNIHAKLPKDIAFYIADIPELNENDVILYHYASEDPLVNFIKKAPCKIVLRYHNVTPPHFFKGYDIGAERNTRKGLRQIKELAPYIDYGIVVSEFNKRDLLEMGYTCPIDVEPILIQFDDYRQQPSEKVMSKYNDGRKNIVFVGRVAPNKKFEDVISAFAAYKNKYESDARLFLVGNYNETDKYYQFLRKHIEKLKVKDVIFPGHIPFNEILAYYSIADLFLCMSEHEGFCVPLVEAMFFRVPILAYSSSAIPSTLGGTGVLVHEKNYAAIADKMQDILLNKEKSENIVEGEQKRLLDFDNDKIGHAICELLDKFMK